MCQHCFGCNPKCPERHWGKRVMKNAVRCPSCAKMNIVTNKKCIFCQYPLDIEQLLKEVSSKVH